MPNDFHILEYKYILKEGNKQTISRLDQNKEMNLCWLVYEEIWVSRISLLFENIDFSLVVKSLGEQLEFKWRHFNSQNYVQLKYFEIMK